MIRFLTCCFLVALSVSATAADRPNVLWITSEDNGPHLGCYGDEYATTPNLDALAERGCRYTVCWSNAPVCAPARTCLITGMYPTSIGGQHMRSMVRLPEGHQMYPQYLRSEGYYCTNNSKEDYNVEKPGQVWDESSRNGHWENRGDEQPFFAIFNHTISHESKIRNAIDAADRIHDPAEAPIPAYHPDTPETRKDWAQYYDRMTMMDAQAGANLEELEQAGVSDDTIVMYYGDHGSGMPRSKRWPYNSGLHVPLIVYIPEKWEHLAPEDYVPGGTCERPVSFVDLAPTLLSVCGVEPPEQFQGHAFLGEHDAGRQPYVYGFRGRMDERYDMVRSITDGRYVYIRNYMPHRIYGQFISYMFQTPTTRVWHDMHDAGELNEAQSHFWERKPAEELYDLQNDPDEVDNLADSEAHADIKSRLNIALAEWMVSVGDLGFLPEGEIHSRAINGVPRDYGRSEDWNLKLGMMVADLATAPSDDPEMGRLIVRDALRYDDSAVRYWGAIGLLNHESAGVESARDELRAALSDDSPSVQIIAAEALGRFGNEEDLSLALPVLLEHANVAEAGVFRAMLALNALDYMDERAASVEDEIRALPKQDDGVPQRMRAYVQNLIGKTLADLEAGR